MQNNTDFPLRESDKIEVELRQLILSLELSPGLSISEAALMKRYGWGRTPLREACQRLAEQSLLRIVPRQGVTITPLSVFDFVEVMDAMGLVIGSAACLACKRLEAHELEQLEEIIARSEGVADQGDFVALSALDYEFHHILAEATGNRYLSRYLSHLHQVATRFNLAGWQRDRSAKHSIAEHQAILAALRQRDSERSRVAMLAHIQNARQRILGVMENA